MRSTKLQDWIDAAGSPEEVQRAFRAMPDELYMELLQEALEQPDIKEMYQKWTDEDHRDDEAISKYCETSRVMGSLFLQLPGKNDGNTASPNIINASGLFLSTERVNVNGERPGVYMQPIVSRKDLEIKYTGALLTQYDWDVLQAITDLAEGQYNVIVSTTPVEILRRMKRDVGGKEYGYLEKSLTRLATASVCIKALMEPEPRGKKIVRPKIMAVIHFLNHLKWIRRDSDEDSRAENNEDYEEEKGMVYYSLDMFYGYLNGYGYALIDWKKRNLLQRNDLAKKLQVLFSGHNAPAQFHSITKLIALCGSEMKVAKFTEHLKKALNAMMNVNLIHSYWISKPPRGQSDKKVLCVWLKEGPSEEYPIPKDREGSYFSKHLPVADE